jgi:hypothetical protein
MLLAQATRAGAHIGLCAWPSTAVRARPAACAASSASSVS